MTQKELARIIEMAKRKEVQKLVLNNQGIRQLPDAIWELENLVKLELDHNQISELSPQIGKLRNLRRLDLGGNRLSSLPAEIGHLTNLTWFSLSENQLTTLPKEVGQMTKLTHLYLYHNQLVELPPELAKLTKLVALSLVNNPLESPPPEIVKKGYGAILEYLRQQYEEGIDYVYEAKLLIVGEGGAGKTTLAKKIKNPNYKLQKEETTHGIDVVKWQFPMENGHTFKVNIWDFGGQEIYHSTHQFFLTRRSLYFLIADTRKEDTDFYYWLNVVELLSDNSPLLIIKNEKQDRHREINEQQLRGRFPNLRDTLATNLATNRGLTKVVQELKHYISTLPLVGQALPKTWKLVRESLEKDPRNYIELSEFLEICQKYGFSRQSDKLQLSGYLHDLGVCLHFQEDPILHNVFILKPKWGTDAVYKVLDNDTVIRNLGRFSWADLEKIWNEPEYEGMYYALLQLMMKFRLCYKLSEERKYIAPQLLTLNTPDYEWEEQENLTLKWVYEFMPKGIIGQLIVTMHGSIANQKWVWRTGVILERENTFAEVVENYDKREMRIRLQGNHKKEFLAIIRNELSRIHDSYKRLKYDELIPCNCSTCGIGQSPYFYTYKTLRKFIEHNQEKIQCQNSFEMVSVSTLIDDVLGNVGKPISMNMQVIKRQKKKGKRKLMFLSYSHKDRGWLDKVWIHLKVLETEGISINLWEDSQIRAGMRWLEEIENALSATKVAILLVSTHFLASDFIRKIELSALLKAAEKDGATILPLVLKPCRFSSSTLSEFQAVNDPLKEPLSKLTENEQDEILLKLAGRVAELMKQEK